MKTIFIHGAGGTSDKWRLVEKHFNREEITLYELPGHGENVDSMCETIEEHARKLTQGITEDCILVGHSMGGLIAIEAAFNEHVKGVVLIGSSYRLPVHPKILTTLAEGAPPMNIFHASYGKNTDKQLLEEERQAFEAVHTEVTLKDFQACDRYMNGKRALVECKKPILAILGDEDRLIPRQTDVDLKKLNPEVEMLTLMRIGHYPMLEAPEEVAVAVHRFKRSVLERISG